MDGKPRHVAQAVGCLPEGLKGIDRPFGQFDRLAARRLEPKSLDQGRLAGVRILAGCLAQGLLVAFDIEDVVGDLEGRSKIPAKGDHRGFIGPGEDGAGPGAEHEKPAGLESLQAPDAWRIEGDVLGGRQVDRLAGYHADATGGMGKGADKADAHLRILVRRRIRQDLEGQRLQSVTGKDRRRLVEGPVTGRPATPQIVVVECGQIVVNQ